MRNMKQKNGLYKDYYEVDKERVIDIIVDASERELVPYVSAVLLMIAGVILASPIMLYVPILAIPLLLLDVIGALKIINAREDARREKIRAFAEEHWQESYFFPARYQGINIQRDDTTRSARIVYWTDRGTVTYNRLPIDEADRINSLPQKPTFVYVLKFPRWKKRRAGYIGYIPEPLNNIANLPIVEPTRYIQ